MAITDHKIRELREDRAHLAAQAGLILKRADLGKRNLTTAENTEFERYHRQLGELRVKIEREEMQRDANVEIDESALRTGMELLGFATKDERDAFRHAYIAASRRKQKDEVFHDWVVNGANISTEHRAIMAGRSGNQSLSAQESRALSAYTDTAGAYTVPEGFADRLTVAERSWSGMRQSRATILHTEDGAELPMPTVNDTAAEATILGENTSAPSLDMSFGRVVLKSYMYSTGVVKLPLQLIADSAFDVETFVISCFGSRFGRGLNRHLTVGTGTNQPLGLITAAPVGATAASATAVTFDDLLLLEHSVDPAYRGKAEYMFHDKILMQLKRQKDGLGRPLWQPGVGLGAPDTIAEKPYVINQNMASTIAPGVKSLAYGDISSYTIRDVGAPMIVRMAERFADSLQIGLLGFSRHDGNLVDAGTGPVQVLQH